MRTVALDRDVIVMTSAVWSACATLVRGGGTGEAFLVDSPVLPDELGVLPQFTEQSGFRVAGLVSTHADWDHVLGPLAFPQASWAVAQSTFDRLQEEEGEAQRSLKEFDERWYLEREIPETIPSPQVLPVPGKLEIGDRELEVHATGGHTSDGLALVVPWAKVLLCGDYLSPLEIPRIEPTGDIDAYSGTLSRLEPLVNAADAVVPGHGFPLTRDQALTILEEDEEYLQLLRSKGQDAPLPPMRHTGEQRKVHDMNVGRIGGR